LPAHFGLGDGDRNIVAQRPAAKSAPGTTSKAPAIGENAGAAKHSSFECRLRFTVIVVKLIPDQPRLWS